MSVHHFPGRSKVDVAANVRAEVARARASQTTIAHVLGENQQWLSRRMVGQVEFRVSELIAIADYLGIHPAVLLGGRPPAGGGPDGPAGHAALSSVDTVQVTPR